MIGKRIFALAPLQLAQAAVGFGAIAAFTRLMTAEEFGRYALALSVSMFAHTLVFTWAEAAAYRFFASAKAERRLRDHFATLLVIAAILGGAALVLTGGLLFLIDPRADIAAISVFAACAALFRFITRMTRETERAAFAMGRYAAAETAYLAIGFAAGVAALMTLHLGAAAPFAGLMVAGLVVFAVDAPRIFARAKGGAPSVARIGAYAGYGAPLALAIAVDMGVQTLARFLIAHQAGPAALGAYAAAFGLARPLDLVFMWAGAALTPLMLAAYEQAGEAGAQSAARRVFATMLALALPAAAGLALVAHPLAQVLVGGALSANASAALPWLALAGLFGGLNVYYWSEAFQLSRRTGLRALVMLAPGALQLALTYALAPSLGALGGAIAAAASAMCASALLGLIGRQIVALPVPRAVLGRVLLATAAMAGVVSLLPADALAMRVPAGCLAYAAAAWLLDVGELRAWTRQLALRVTARRLAPALAEEAQ
ncbi:MAG TPA: polysaccharide biosynthesis C-terminal domain-containing protein [Caulobacterales bacterium]|nr:polysaccharide biosynthesis C-terminal domain-containing protein [Caulobacterales bacterium]